MNQEIEQPDGKFTVLFILTSGKQAHRKWRKVKDAYGANRPVYRKIDSQWAILRKMPPPVADYFFK